MAAGNVLFHPTKTNITGFKLMRHLRVRYRTARRLKHLLTLVLSPQSLSRSTRWVNTVPGKVKRLLGAICHAFRAFAKIFRRLTRREPVQAQSLQPERQDVTPAGGKGLSPAITGMRAAQPTKGAVTGMRRESEHGLG